MDDKINMPHCRSCKANPSKQEIRAESVFGGKPEHKFWQCGACGLVYLWPVPSEEEERSFYAREFEKYMSCRAANDRDWSGPEAHLRANQDHVKRRLKFIEKEISPGKDILEIGCSSGFMLDAFRDRGMNCVGIEPSQAFLEFIKQRRHIAFSSVEELRQNMPGKSFDLIVHFFVLEHIRDTQRIIQEQLGMLKDKGKIISEVPCVNDPLTSVYRIPAFEKFYWSIAHHYYFSPESLSVILDGLNCSYEFIPEQRYDISNHLVWLMEGKPGGQGRFNHIFSEGTIKNYADDLKKSWNCDTLFLYITKKQDNR